MSTRKRQIESLLAQITRLEKEQAREEQEKQALEDTRQGIFDILNNANVSFESFIRFNYKQVRRIITKIDAELAKAATPATSASPAEKKTVKKKVVAKKKGRTARTTRVKKVIIKIPAGQYTNIPSEPETVFTVKEKGPRPKAVKAYAEEVGLDAFMEQCRVSE